MRFSPDDFQVTLERDISFGPTNRLIAVGEKVPSFQIQIVQTMGELDLEQVLKKGPLIVNFIAGLWCPYCLIHLRNLALWQVELNKAHPQFFITTLVVSNQSTHVIRDWLQRTPVPYLYASDPEQKVASLFGVQLTPDDFLKPATFLIDRDRSVRLSFGGKRNQAFYNQLDEELKPLQAQTQRP